MNQTIFLAIVAIVVIFAIGFYLWRRNTSAHSVHELPEYKIAFSPDLQQFNTIVNTVNDVKATEYRDIVTSMRMKPTEILNEIELLTLKIPRAEYATHRFLVLTAGALQNPIALSYLRSLVFRPWPKSSQITHNAEEEIEETILRSLAIEAIEQIAIDSKNHEAMDALGEVMSSPSLTLRALALVALRGVDVDGQYLERISGMLPDDQKYLLHIRRVKITDVSQISDPRIHLLGPELGVPGAPLLPDDAHRLVERQSLPIGRGDSPQLSKRSGTK
jgi:hypothetical protein